VSSFGTASGVAISARFVSHGPSPKVRQTPSFIFSGSEIPIQSYHHGICVFDCRRRSPCCDHDHLDLRPLPFAVHLSCILTSVLLPLNWALRRASDLLTSTTMHVHGILREIPTYICPPDREPVVLQYTTLIISPSRPLADVHCPCSCYLFTRRRIKLPYAP
jgi:hypothetical protein